MALAVALAQYAPRAGAVAENMRQASLWIERAAGGGARLVVLPELVDTGYEMGAVREHAAGWEDGPAVEIARLAERHGVFIAAGLSERTAGSIHNSVGVFSDRGEMVGHYRKAHLFSFGGFNERTVLTAGDDAATIPGPDVTLGVMVCYDLRFPELARKLTLDGARVLVVPAAFPNPRDRHWRTLLAARAMENQVFVLGANRVGADGDLDFCGHSTVLDPWGEVLAAADGTSEGLVTATLDLSVLDEARRTMPVWRDRRPELYGGGER